MAKNCPFPSDYLYIPGDFVGIARAAQDVIGLSLVVLTTIACFLLTGLISPGLSVVIACVSFCYIGSDTSLALINNKKVAHYPYSGDAVKFGLKVIGMTGLIVFAARWARRAVDRHKKEH